MSRTASYLPIAGMAAASAAALIAPVAAHAQSASADRAALLQGVESVRAPGGLVGTLTLLGDGAVPVVGGRQGEARVPIVAAAHAARGRVVVYAHGNFLGSEGLKDAGTARLLTNAVRWTGGGKAAVRVGLVEEGDAADTLRAAGFSVKTLRAADLIPANLSTVDVLAVNPDAFDGPQGAAPAAAVQAFVHGGGGLVTYGVGWGWQQLHPGASLADEAGFNRLLVPLVGIGCDGGTAEPTGPGGAFLADPTNVANIVTTSAVLTRIEKSIAGGTPLTATEVGPITRALTQATDVLPANDSRILPRLKALIARVGPVTPTKYAPITLADPLSRVAAVLEARQLARTPADQIKAHPAANAFPGSVAAEAPRLASRVIPVDTAVPDWHSTGLYAAPGEVISVTVPAAAAGKGLGVRIGAHRDSLWNLDTWPRFPEITVEKRIPGTTLRIANAFGGTVYVTVPESGPGSRLGTVPVTISGAVAQPYFVKGKTTPAQWDALRSAPAPWAELQGDRIILTVPSYTVRGLKDPVALMTYWDQVADAAADLYSIPHERKRQERYCVDIEISAGYMHSGYPIMAHDDVDRTFVSLRTLRGTDGLKTWGFYHELGHNHQRPEWTWNGLGEVSNNLLSLYGDETFNGVPSNYENSHPAIAPAERRARLLEYLAKENLSPEGMTSDPWLALTFFIDLRQGFGWDPFKKVFGEYRGLSDAERPKTEVEKHDQFLTRFSQAIGRNLGPYFLAWGLNTTDAARKSVANLPVWMPADWPTPAEVAAARTKLGMTTTAAAATPGR